MLRRTSRTFVQTMSKRAWINMMRYGFTEAPFFGSYTRGEEVDGVLCNSLPSRRGGSFGDTLAAFQQQHAAALEHLGHHTPAHQPPVLGGVRATVAPSLEADGSPPATTPPLPPHTPPPAQQQQQQQQQQQPQSGASSVGMAPDFDSGDVPVLRAPAAPGARPHKDYLVQSQREQKEWGLYCRALIRVSGGSRQARDWIAGAAALMTNGAAITEAALQHIATNEDLERFIEHSESKECGLSQAERDTLYNCFIYDAMKAAMFHRTFAAADRARVVSAALRLGLAKTLVDDVEFVVCEENQVMVEKTISLQEETPA